MPCPLALNGPLPHGQDALPNYMPTSVFAFAFPSVMNVSATPPGTTTKGLEDGLCAGSFSSQDELSYNSSSAEVDGSPNAPLYFPTLPFPLVRDYVPSTAPTKVLAIAASSPCAVPSPLRSLRLFLVVLPSPLRIKRIIQIYVMPGVIY